ncbi:MAG: MarR family transcriptional regulator [Clostridia bacterium]|nr:MarR family transcriptional regulator [Clostridia bacterium]
MNHIGRMLKVVSNYMDMNSNNNLAEINMTRSQMGALVYVFVSTRKGKEVNQVDIEREFNLKNPTVTGILNRLEEKEYIKRVPSSKDKRYKKIELTDSGKKIVECGKVKADEMEDKLLSVLEDSEKEELKRLLNKVIESIKREEIC